MTDPRRPSVRLALGGLLALAAAMGIGRFVYTPVLPPMAEALDWSRGQAGLLASANFAGYLGGALLAATPLVPGSRRAWLLAALAASAVTTAAMGLGASMAAFVPLRFAGGAASAFVLVFSSALVLDRLAEAGRSRLAALHFAGVGAGIALSAVVVATLEAAGLGWRWHWLATGGLSLAALALVVPLVPEDTDRRAPATPAAPPAAARRAPAGLVVAYGLFGFGYVITATFLVAIVRASEDAQALEPVVWLVVGLTAAPSVALWTWVSARAGVGRTFALAAVLEALGITASVLWLATPGALLAAALLGGTFMGLTALGLIGARAVAGGDPRRTLGVMTASFGLGQIVGPAYAGLVGDATGSFLIPSLTAAGALLAAAWLAPLALRERPGRPGAAAQE